MSDLTIKIPGSDRELTMPQARTLLALAQEHGPDYTWHLADCGCCVCFHPDGDSSRGWLIGADGGSAYMEEAHG